MSKLIKFKRKFFEHLKKTVVQEQNKASVLKAF